MIFLYQDGSLLTDPDPQNWKFRQLLNENLKAKQLLEDFFFSVFDSGWEGKSHMYIETILGRGYCSCCPYFLA